MSQGPESKQQAERFLDLWEGNMLAWWRESAGLLFPPAPDDAGERTDRAEAAGAAHGDGGGRVGRRGGGRNGGSL